MPVLFDLNNLNVLSSSQPEADLWVVFVTLVAILVRQNIAVNPKVSTVCTDAGSRSGIGQFCPVVDVTTMQEDWLLQGPIIFSEITRLLLLLGRRLKHFKCHIQQISERFEDHDVLSISEVHKLCSQLPASDSNLKTHTGSQMKLISRISQYSV